MGETSWISPLAAIGLGGERGMTVEEWNMKGTKGSLCIKYRGIRGSNL
jgi:hypothetical protein